MRRFIKATLDAENENYRNLIDSLESGMLTLDTNLDEVEASIALINNDPKSIVSGAGESYGSKYEDYDYTLKYIDNKKVGKAGIKVTGKGLYTDSVTVNFDITKADLKSAYAEPAVITKAFKNNELTFKLKIKPELYINGTKLKTSPKEFSYRYYDAEGRESDCVKEGSYTIRITPGSSGSSYTGQAEIPMVVTSKPMIVATPKAMDE